MEDELKELIYIWKESTNRIVYEFCQKHDLTYDKDGWVGMQVGGVICLSDYFFGFDTILYDMTNNIKKGLVIKWYDKVMEDNSFVNYEVYAKSI